MGTSTSFPCHAAVDTCQLYPETTCQDETCTVGTARLCHGHNSEFTEEEVDRETSGIITIKATLASNALRCLSRRDDGCSWEQLRCEFETQSGIWERLSCGEASHEGHLAQLKSKIECGLAMQQCGCNGEAIVALESALMSDDAAAMKHLNGHSTAMEANAKEAFARARLSPAMKACVEEVLVQTRISQARNELADFLDMVCAFDESRFEKPQSWVLSRAKACDLKYGVLKEYLNEVFASEAQLRAARTVAATHEYVESYEATMVPEGHPVVLEF